MHSHHPFKPSSERIWGLM
uniref:Uncharacterized protein n=1 Tax=Anguilla anguilla TaxID=7936 RepID=A0A0E9USW3_ANGAN